MYFILSNSCKIVKGKKRTLLCDYGRAEFYFISNEYYVILKKLEKKPIKVVRETINIESRIFFDEFIELLLSKEIGLIHDSKKAFPKISEEFEEPEIIKDIIIEIDFNRNNYTYIKNICQEISEVKCQSIQIRVLNTFKVSEIKQLLKCMSQIDTSYIEIHLSDKCNIDKILYHKMVEENTRLSCIFVYGCETCNREEVFSEENDEKILKLGEVYFLNYYFDEGNCCGIINYENLNFNSLPVYNRLKTKNGCLDKKITIDSLGNIKNCPSMKEIYANIYNSSLKSVLKDENYKKYWYINKDKISICKECEFRYCCSDCRAFLTNESDKYSKPLKCGYNPETCQWEDINNFLKFVDTNIKINELTCES